MIKTQENADVENISNPEFSTLIYIVTYYVLWNCNIIIRYSNLLLLKKKNVP